MTIRKLTSADLAAFRAFRTEMCRRHPEAFGQTPEEVVGMTDEKLLDWFAPVDVFPQKFVLAAFEGDALIGTVGFRREDATKESHRGFVWTVYVQPEYRGRGLSKHLMLQVIEDCRSFEGLESLFLTVAVTQVNARALYKSLGFVSVGQIPDGYKLPDGSYVGLEQMMLPL